MEVFVDLTVESSDDDDDSDLMTSYDGGDDSFGNEDGHGSQVEDEVEDNRIGKRVKRFK